MLHFLRMGRRWSLITLQACTGLTCILVGMSLVMDFGSIQVVINCLGTFFAEMCFGLVYLYCAELYPTGLRATATGICSSVGRYAQLPAKGKLDMEVSLIFLPLLTWGHDFSEATEVFLKLTVFGIVLNNFFQLSSNKLSFGEDYREINTAINCHKYPKILSRMKLSKIFNYY